MGSVRSTLSLKLRLVLYVPLIGFAAAITEQRAYRLVIIPAFEIEIDSEEQRESLQLIRWTLSKLVAALFAVALVTCSARKHRSMF